MKIGVYGGTFNPIHNGHLSLAKNCADALGLDKVVFIPTFSPPHKSDESIAEPFHRINMCRLAARTDSRFEVSDIEIRRAGISYTIDTLWELHKVYKNAEFYLIVGSDMYLTITSWKMYLEIFKLATVVTASRAPDQLDLLYAQKQILDKAFLKSIVLTDQAIEVSSTELRKGEKTELLPGVVADYIFQNALYHQQDQKVVYDMDIIKSKLSTMLGEKRLIHSLSVAEQAVILARKNNEDQHLAYIAGIVHDICKEMDKQELLHLLEKSEYINDPIFLAQPQIWHGFAGSIFIENELKIYNNQIIEAVRYHTTGKEDMSVFEKIIFLADLISFDRDYSDVEHVREMCYNDLDEGMGLVLQFTVGELVRLAMPLFNDTLKAYNFYIRYYKGKPLA